MELLTKVMKYFSMFQSKNALESHNTAHGISDTASFDRAQGANVAAPAEQISGDVRAKVAAIAAAIHHHELEMENTNKGGLLGVAAVVAAIHHHNKLKK